MQMKLSSDITAQQGFTLDHGGYSKSQQEGNMKAKRYYIPPCTIRSVPSALHATPCLQACSASGMRISNGAVPDHWKLQLEGMSLKAVTSSGVSSGFSCQMKIWQVTSQEVTCHLRKVP